jgi:ArsR family transcriptional regulator, arsenate/arsenite/antimonite-responsive transcriptional repressor
MPLDAAVAYNPLPRLTPVALPTRNGGMKKPHSTAASGMTLWDFMAVTKALSDETRVRLLLALREQELCLCQLIELAGLAPSTVSKHMSILRQSGLVEGRKEGRWMYYRLAGPDASPAVGESLEWMRKHLARDPQVVQDAQRLRAILKIDLRRLCESQGASCNKSP